MLKARCKFGTTCMAHAPVRIHVYTCTRMYARVTRRNTDAYLHARRDTTRAGRRGLADVGRAARKVLGAHDCDNAKRNIAAKFIGRSSNGTRSEPCEK